MRSFTRLAALLLLVTSIYGCDQNQYQIVTGPDGALYRFNKKTGALNLMMKNNKIVQPVEPYLDPGGLGLGRDPSLDPRGLVGRGLEKPVSWKESKYPGKNLKARFEMVWRENRLCYKFTVYPYKSLEKIFSKKRQDYIYSLMRPGFSVELTDKNGFLVKEIKINLWSMNRIDGEDGAAKELVMNSQIDCEKQSYRSITGYDIKWSLEGEMIENDAGEEIKNSPTDKENK